jgi:hypothetical protein
MCILHLVLSILLSFFSTAVLSYISMATMIGPWMAPTLVLISGLFLKLRKFSPQKSTQEVALIQSVGSLSGLIAVAVGFTLPTLYFLDPETFISWTNHPLQFSFLIGLITVSGGGLGLWLAKTFSKKLLDQEKLSFPVSHLIHRTITSQSQTDETKRMLSGFSITGLFCLLRDGLTVGKSFFISKIIPSENILVLSSIFGKEIDILLKPMFWAIGFIAGMKIVLPLLVGMISKYIILYPLGVHHKYLPFSLFPQISNTTLTLAFCSGLILAEVLPGLLKYPSIVWKTIKQYSGYNFLSSITSKIKNTRLKTENSLKLENILSNFELIFSFILSVSLLSFFSFPALSQLLIIGLSAIAAYQISYLAGKIGLAQIGRFVTFVMIPSMLLFKLSYFQISIMCVFVACCMATSSYALFNYKIGNLCDIDIKKIHNFQWLGLLSTAIFIGIIILLLVKNLSLGTNELFAQRALSRSLLVKSFGFDWTVVFIGFLYGLLVKKMRLSPSMVFGGILMPNNLTIGLVIGATGTLLTKDKKYYTPFLSGISAGESMWMIFSILAKMI